MDTPKQQYTAQGPDMETRLLGVGPADETVHSTWLHHLLDHTLHVDTKFVRNNRM